MIPGFSFADRPTMFLVVFQRLMGLVADRFARVRVALDHEISIARLEGLWLVCTPGGIRLLHAAKQLAIIEPLLQGFRLRSKVLEALTGAVLLTWLCSPLHIKISSCAVKRAIRSRIVRHRDLQVFGRIRRA